MRIGINCGHTVSRTVGCGAVGYLDESVETRNVGYALERLLSERGQEVIDCTNDYASTISQNLANIVNMANRQKLDLFVSIHFNAGGGTGTEVYTYGGKQLPEAVRVCENMYKLGFPNRGVKDGSRLYVVRRSDAPAMLIEVCFVDRQKDADLYHQLGAETIAEAICDAILGSQSNNYESEELTMSQYAELKELIMEQSKRIETLEHENSVLRQAIGWTEENKDVPLYAYVDDNTAAISSDTNEILTKLIKEKKLSVDESGAFQPLSKALIRMLVILNRK